ncbi:hypothetical protein [Agrococcus jejuensis]|uniref:Lipoprotein n=1 Tax=Agrococcus jejuensis TaxID=399736 RepID=A0A1G8AMJ2_9MICO|nr:hypothetical protein [Agrococcus jejuensis]SDH22164.1 hypothetical protein SAMN04489720_0453 [Agrococcus jejuensis]
MKLPRIAGVAALGAAAILTLAGCIQLPSIPQAPTTTQPTTTDPGTTAPATSAPATDAGDALVDTQWTGSVSGVDAGIDLVFTFEADGTLYITQWNDLTNVPFDSPSDTWSVAGGTLEITLSQIEDIDRIDLTGAYSGGGSLSLTGVDGNGASGYTATFTQG